jgi:DNA invertase Pin-like site-specific DNA recombinase
MLDHLRPGDVVVVCRLDRFGQSLKIRIAIVDNLKDRGVGFRSLSESIDTTTANRKLFFSVMGPLAEFERDLISERTMAGLAAARARGWVGGPSPR